MHVRDRVREATNRISTHLANGHYFEIRKEMVECVEAIDTALGDGTTELPDAPAGGDVLTFDQKIVKLKKAQLERYAHDHDVTLPDDDKTKDAMVAAIVTAYNDADDQEDWAEPDPNATE